MKKALSFLLVLFFLILIAVPTFAVGRPTDAGAQGLGSRNQEVTPGEGRMKACEARQDAIKNRMTHLTQLATNMEEKFGDIATRVENYYTNKVQPSGKTVTNYSTLVADIATKKAAVQTALTTAQTDATAFSCTSGTLKQQVTQFRMDMQAVKEALKDYRTSVKNLIVAVHSVTGEENSESGTPKPTK